MAPISETGSSRDFGTKVSYNPSWTGPLNVKRKAENISFITAYYLLVCVWIGVSVYAILAGDKSKLYEKNPTFANSDEFVAEEWWVILVVFMLAAFWSILFLVLLRVAARPMVYVSIALLFILIFFAIIYAAAALLIDQSPRNFALFILLIVTLIFTILMFMTKSKFIPVTCEIIREAAKAILFFPLLFLYTLVYFGLALTFTLFNLNVFEYIYSISLIKEYHPIYLYICYIVNLVALVWVNNHLWGIYKISVAGSYGTWYWTMNKREVPGTTTLRFVYIAIRYHIGPVAFGSLILTVCCILRFLISVVFSSTAGDDVSADPITCLFRSCMLCCYAAISCIEAFVESITGLSYVYIGLHGGGFLDAARESFNLFKRNFVKIFILSQIVDILYFIAMIVITILSVLVFWGIMSAQSIKLEDRVVVLVILVICILALTASMLQPLSIAVDTIFMCVLEDFEMNGGSNRPYHMSDKLKKLVLENRLD